MHSLLPRWVKARNTRAEAMLSSPAPTADFAATLNRSGRCLRIKATSLDSEISSGPRGRFAIAVEQGHEARRHQPRALLSTSANDAEALKVLDYVRADRRLP